MQDFSMPHLIVARPHIGFFLLRYPHISDSKNMASEDFLPHGMAFHRLVHPVSSSILLVTPNYWLVLLRKKSVLSERMVPWSWRYALGWLTVPIHSRTRASRCQTVKVDLVIAKPYESNALSGGCIVSHDMISSYAKNVLYEIRRYCLQLLSFLLPHAMPWHGTRLVHPVSSILLLVTPK
mmetsp:Transcript_44143/g.106375  ORF Transcript_44143/g.106375 Transcript_44143/m.106375 type:complete len:180 (-) Transcript_44143:321-860(-)